MHSYSEKYLNSASVILAEMVDYAVNDCGIACDEFVQLFIVSGAASKMERGNLRYVTGRSGVEVADEVIQKTTTARKLTTASVHADKSPEYWAGWALAQYQWHTAMQFNNILRHLPLSAIVKLYLTLHDADITKFYAVADGIIAQDNPQTHLKRIRTAAGITQEKLAQESGVSLRSIQMYEQRNKDINKAQALALAKISRALGCDVENLLERESESNREERGRI